MSAFDRIELERALRTDGRVGELNRTVIHNVRLRVGVEEIYGREDWIRLETARSEVLGPRTVDAPRSVIAPLGATSSLVASEWRLGTEESAPRFACLSIVRSGRIVREWQYADQTSGALPVRYGDTTPRFGIPWEYGEMRAALGQTVPDAGASAIAPADIASHPVVAHWHRLCNLREGETRGLLAGFAEPVMFCERLVAPPGGDVIALQWRLFGRHVTDAWGLPASGYRLELPGLSFFQMDGGRIVDHSDHFDRSVLAAQIARRVAGAA